MHIIEGLLGWGWLGKREGVEPRDGAGEFGLGRVVLEHAEEIDKTLRLCHDVCVELDYLPGEAELIPEYVADPGVRGGKEGTRLLLHSLEGPLVHVVLSHPFEVQGCADERRARDDAFPSTLVEVEHERGPLQDGFGAGAGVLFRPLLHPGHFEINLVPHGEEDDGD